MVKITTICGQDAFVKIPEPEAEIEAILCTRETENHIRKWNKWFHLTVISTPTQAGTPAASTGLPWTHSSSSGS